MKELALELGVEREAVLAWLRLHDEYVPSVNSRIETPVARKLREAFPLASPLPALPLTSTPFQDVAASPQAVDDDAGLRRVPADADWPTVQAWTWWERDARTQLRSWVSLDPQPRRQATALGLPRDASALLKIAEALLQADPRDDASGWTARWPRVPLWVLTGTPRRSPTRIAFEKMPAWQRLNVWIPVSDGARQELEDSISLALHELTGVLDLERATESLRLDIEQVRAQRKERQAAEAAASAMAREQARELRRLEAARRPKRPYYRLVRGGAPGLGRH